jgi:hypothetical protein
MFHFVIQILGQVLDPTVDPITVNPSLIFDRRVDASQLGPL